MIKAIVLSLTLVTLVFALFQNCSQDYVAAYSGPAINSLASTD